MTEEKADIEMEDNMGWSWKKWLEGMDGKWKKNGRKRAGIEEN